MNNRIYNYLADHHVGPGGRRCYCCNDVCRLRSFSRSRRSRVNVFVARDLARNPF